LEIGDGLQQIPWVLLHYRHASQAERWHSVEMEWEGNRWRGSIAAEYTNSPYPILYFFEVQTTGTELLGNGTVRSVRKQAIHVPGFDHRFLNRPYYVVRMRAGDAKTLTV
jgi:hypothetical protein